MVPRDSQSKVELVRRSGDGHHRPVDRRARRRHGAEAPSQGSEAPQEGQVPQLVTLQVAQRRHRGAPGRDAKHVEQQCSCAMYSVACDAPVGARTG